MEGVKLYYVYGGGTNTKKSVLFYITVTNRRVSIQFCSTWYGFREDLFDAT